MTDPDNLIEAVAAELSEEHRILWIRTILALNGTEPQRRAFIDGYNGFEPTPHGSPRMYTNHALGARVSTLLASMRDPGNG